MNFDDLTDLWKNQPAPQAEPWNVTLERVRTGARKFDRAIFWRDVRECLACGVLAVIFGQAAWERTMESGFATALWIATVLPLAVAAFLLIDRRRHANLQPGVGEPLVAEVGKTIARLRHQEHLLRNIMWWYLLPLGIAGMIFGMEAVISNGTPWPITLIVGVFLLAFLAGMNFWIYRLNQRAIAKKIRPEISKQEAVLRELSAEPETPRS